MRSLIEIFKKRIPEILTLGNLGLKRRHWQEISNIVGFVMFPDQNLTLTKVLNLNLGKFVPQFEIISDGASKENNLEKRLNTMVDEWKDLNFTILDYKYSKHILKVSLYNENNLILSSRDSGTYILSGIDEVQLLLDDHILKTTTMKSSPFVKPFEKKILYFILIYIIEQ